MGRFFVGTKGLEMLCMEVLWCFGCTKGLQAMYSRLCTAGGLKCGPLLLDRGEWHGRLARSRGGSGRGQRGMTRLPLPRVRQSEGGPHLADPAAASRLLRCR